MITSFSKNNTYKDFFPAQTQQPTNVIKQQEQLPAIKIEEKEKKHPNSKKVFGIIGISVGSAALLTLIGLSVLSKGFASGFAHKIANLSKKLQKKIYELSAETKDLSIWQKMSLRFSKTLQPITDTLQSTSNMTAIKDSWLRHWLKNFKLEPLIVKMNNAFKSIITKNTRNYYTSAETSNLKLCMFLEELANKATSPELKQRLLIYSKQIKDMFKNNFATAEHFQRSTTAYQKMYGIDEKVYDRLFKDGGLFKNIKKYKKYITLEMIEKEKEQLLKSLSQNKSRLSNDISDNHLRLKQLLNEIKINVVPKDEKAVKLTHQLDLLLEQYRVMSGPNESLFREKNIQTLREQLLELGEIFKSNKKYAKNHEAIKEKINTFLKLTENKSMQKGLAQEAISIVKEAFGKNSAEYVQAKKYMTKLNENLNTAINSEISSFEKLAELQVGSLPTDILGILGPTGLATLLVINSDDKHEKISTTLTKGIPILGGVASSYYGSTRGFTGIKSMGLGLSTGIALNILGSAVDNVYKKYAEKQSVLKTAFEAFTKLQNKTPETQNNTTT